MSTAHSAHNITLQGLIKDEPLIIVGGGSGIIEKKKEVELTGRKKKASALLPKKKKASALLLRKKKSKRLIAEEKKSK